MASKSPAPKKKAPPMYYKADSDRTQIRMGDVDSLESPDILKTEMGNKPAVLLTGKLKKKGMPSKGGK